VRSEAAINLNPYQGLKPGIGAPEHALKGRNKPKPLSGIETFSIHNFPKPIAYSRNKPKPLSGIETSIICLDISSKLPQ